MIKPMKDEYGFITMVLCSHEVYKDESEVNFCLRLSCESILTIERCAKKRKSAGISRPLQVVYREISQHSFSIGPTNIQKLQVLWNEVCKKSFQEQKAVIDDNLNPCYSMKNDESMLYGNMQA